MDKPEVLKMKRGAQLALIEALLLSVLLKLDSLVCQGTSLGQAGEAASTRAAQGSQLRVVQCFVAK